MKIIKDKIFILGILTILGLTYLSISRGKWKTYILQKGKTEQSISLSKNIKIEIENSINNDFIISNSTEFIVTENCAKIDSLSIKLLAQTNFLNKELTKTKTKVVDIENLEFDTIGNITKESYLSNHIYQLCSNQRIEITNWFHLTDRKLNEFKLQYFIKEVGKKPITKEIELEKVTRFRIIGKNHYDYVILLYPLLWIFLTILLIIKVFLLIKKSRNRNET
jgi:polyribonucleotide nucleotidyltransferase